MRSDFEALEICNEKFKIQAGRMGRVLGGVKHNDSFDSAYIRGVKFKG